MDDNLILPMKQHEVVSVENFNALLKNGSDLGVSDFYVVAQRQIKAKLHGINRLVTNFDLPSGYVNKIAELVYGSAGVTSRLVGDSLACSYQFKSGKNLYRFRVNMMKGHKGIAIVMRPLDQMPPKVSDLGIEDIIVNSFVSLCDGEKKSLKGKLFIVAGETGSGKSSLIAALIRYLIEESYLKSTGLNIWTAEAPIEYTYDSIYEGINVIEQFEKGRSFETFSDAIRSYMRMDPTLILVGETRDYETLHSVLEASNTGHVAVTTIHANSIAEIVTRMIDLIPAKLRTDGEIKRVLSSIGVASFQKLVRRKTKGSDPKKGGRIALREYLIFTDEVQEYILTHGQDNIVKSISHCVKEFGRSFEQHRQELIQEGLIDG